MAEFGTTLDSKETVAESEFQSQPCFTIHYTHDEALEQSSCCRMGKKTLACVNLDVEGGGRHG
eukprot:scaffold63066_cov43-Cyclotella_meneghiniana.AAC.1